MKPVSALQPAELAFHGTKMLERLARAKRSFATRRVWLDTVTSLDSTRTPRAGDVVLARVIRLGQHSGLQLPDGRRATLFVGDDVIVAYGNRYAPDQFEALIPADLGLCSLAAGGGIAARVVAAHHRMKQPTQIAPVGLLCRADGEPINVADFALPELALPTRAPAVIVVAGTSMNAGKTTAAAQLVHGLSSAGFKVGATKLTGTGACGDTSLMRDAGACTVLDFTDMGLATTYLAPLEAIERVAEQLIAHLAADAVDVIVAEIADGLYQAETAALLRSPRLRRWLRGLLFASPDAMGAMSGVQWLVRQGLQPTGLVGAMTASPLAVREAETATQLPVFTSAALADPDTAHRLLLTASLGAAFDDSACDARLSA